MKATKTIIKSAVTGIAVAALIFSTSCSKDESSQGPSATPEPEKLITNPRLIAEIDTKVQEMPVIGWYNSTMDKVIIFDPKSETKSFNFVSPPAPNFGGPFVPGFALNEAILFLFSNYSGPNSINWVEDATPFDLFSDGSSSTVVAGNTVLNINNTTFYSSGEASEDNLPPIGGLGTPTTAEAKVAVGIDGDMEALTKNNFQNDAEIYQYFHGLVFCIVYANAVLGNYAFADWFDYLYQSNSYLQNMAFVWIYAFTVQSWSIFFSQGGILNTVNGGLNFGGRFYSATVDNEALNESGSSGSGNEMKYMENIHGFGEMRE